MASLAFGSLVVVCYGLYQWWAAGADCRDRFQRGDF